MSALPLTLVLAAAALPAKAGEQGTTVTETAKLLAEDGGVLAEFGTALALDGSRLLIGARHQSGPAFDSGAAYVFALQGGRWVQIKLAPDDLETFDTFAHSVSIEENRLAVGAPGHGPSGAVYIFEHDGVEWLQTAKLEPAGPSGQFGRSVALDGDRLAVGAICDSGGCQGAAFVFDYDGTGWSETAKLVAHDGVPQDNLGNEIALAGRRLIVAALGAHVGGVQIGAVYVWELAGGVWTETAKITPSDAGEHVQPFFADSLALDGRRLAVGAPLDDALGTNAGAAYVYVFVDGVWTEVAKLTAVAGKAGDNMGSSIGLAGRLLAVGGVGADVGGMDTGAVWLFGLDGGSWTELTRVVPSDVAGQDFFGVAAALDGRRLLAGSLGDDDTAPDSGSAYLFEIGAGALAPEVVD